MVERMPGAQDAPEVVTLGEAMLRLSPEGGRPLEQAERLAVYAAGAEANVAVALARLGVRVGWVSRLVDNALGRKIAGELRRHGVDVSRVVWTPEGRVGVYFVELAVPPRESYIIYDRRGSAITQIAAEEVDWGYVRRAALLHTTGITLALGEPCRRLVARAVEEVKQAGGQVALDVNYRARLWSPEEARRALDAVLPEVDVLQCAEEDARQVLGLAGDPEQMVEAARSRYGCAVVALTLGAKGAVASDGQVRTHPALGGQVVDPVGRGDAFAAGFLFGYLEGDIDRALAYGTALAAFKQTYHGDFLWATHEDLRRALGGPPGDIRR
ncbi:MAG: sugar kinase [Armatimonadetes bacterium]|nr:sugar kinase [Armatimonadota bacterium]